MTSHSYSFDKPSSSIPQKRPSPNLNEHQLLPKRINASQINFGLRNESTLESNLDKTPCGKEKKQKNVYEYKCLPESNENTRIDSLASCSQNEERSDKNQEAANNLNSIKKSTMNFKSISINSCLTTEPFVKDFKSKWLLADTMGGCQTFNNDSVKLYDKPFKICVISEFLENSSFTQEIVDEMSQMEWHRKQMDLYEFHQTTDLANLPPNAKPALKSIYNMLLNDMLPWMIQVTGLPLTRISASCSMYNYGDYLLVHDDLLSDRQIAFVFYCSPFCHEWREEMGGALELFESDLLTGQPKYPIVKQLTPRNNQFVFFHVGKDSFHQVGEVTNLVYPRLTINGWFHGPESLEDEKKIEYSDAGFDTSHTEYQQPSTDELDLNEWINACYLRKRVKHGIQQHIEEKSEASLEVFLIPDFFDLLVCCLKENTELDWVLEGPANQRKYESLRFAPQSTGPLKDLYSLFTSNSMFSLLHEYTELDFHGVNARNPTCSVQLCRFTQGCYTLLGDSASFADSALEAILFFNVHNGVGKITYLSPSESDVNEYSAALESDATTSTVDISGIDTSDISIVSAPIKNASSLSTISKKPKRKSQYKSTCILSNIPKVVETSEEETNVEYLSSSSNEDSLMGNVAAVDSACSVKKIEVRAIVHENNEHDSSEIESSRSESDDEDFVELAQEDALLTIHPENNSLNLVYRLSGQAKFVKYISKNCLKSDEYIYILFATYKE